MIPRGRRRWRRSDGSCEPAKRSSRPFNILRQSAHGGACPGLRQPEVAGDSAKVSLLRGGASLGRLLRRQGRSSRRRRRSVRGGWPAVERAGERAQKIGRAKGEGPRRFLQRPGELQLEDIRKRREQSAQRIRQDELALLQRENAGVETEH